MPISEVYNEDCMIGMARYPDKYFDLAIVDPPYGDNSGNAFKDRLAKYNDFYYKNLAPTDDYFIELKRISINQIIWGGNYFNLGRTKGFIFWYKHQPVETYADGEFAWTSFETTAKCFDYKYFGNINSEENRIHSTQKPVALYKWILRNYAKPGDKILDTHLGSQSSRIAAWDGGFDFWGWELDPDYFNDGCKRFDNHIKQLNLFA